MSGPFRIRIAITIEHGRPLPLLKKLGGTSARRIQCRVIRDTKTRERRRCLKASPHINRLHVHELTCRPNQLRAVENLSVNGAFVLFRHPLHDACCRTNCGGRARILLPNLQLIDIEGRLGQLVVFSPQNQAKILQVHIADVLELHT